MTNKVSRGAVRIEKTYTWHDWQPFSEVLLSETFRNPRGVMFNKSGKESAFCHELEVHFAFLADDMVQRLKTSTVTKHYD